VEVRNDSNEPTGCQDILEYTNPSHKFSAVDAYILQAPTSDRETATLLMAPESIAQTLKHASDMIASGKQDESMPKSLIPPIFTSPITAYRWHSLVSVGGDDDFFSTDLGDDVLKETFGRLNTPTLILPSEKDEMVPESVDKEGLLRRWMEAVKDGVVSGFSGVNPGADHELSKVHMQEWFAERVVQFLGTLE
jgi:hypothetical protein